MTYILIFIYFLNVFYIRKKGLQKSSFMLHFFFITIIFLGPSIYYKLGFTAYSHSFQAQDLVYFEFYGVSVFTFSLIFLFYLARKKKSLFNSYFLNYGSRNKSITLIYFLFWYGIVLLYLLVYIQHIPIVNLILTGNLPERLDQSDSVKLFYTFSSFFMVFIPSGYFFFVRHLKKPWYKLFFLLLVVFILTSGGHKGIVTFFVFFAILFSGFKFNLKYIVIGTIGLASLLAVYTVSKGRSFNKETFFYLLESPPRRFFVTQGSGFIARISMDRRNLYKGNVYEYQVIKKETFQAIYANVNEKGAAPTMFLGDLHVRYGYVLTMLSYGLFLILAFPLIKGLDNMEDKKLYIWWNLFMVFFLLGMAELSHTSILRVALALFNFIALLLLPRLKYTPVEKA